MTVDKAIRWWPIIGIAAMALLGIAVGKGSTRVDDWFVDTGAAHHGLDRLLVFTEPRLLLVVLCAAVATALFRRRWLLAVAVVVTPGAAVVAERLLKRLFGRQKEEALCYPSGHVTLTVVVLGMLVLVAGARMWMLVAAAVWALLALLGQAFTVHYVTDTVGGVLLGTALVCLAARWVNLTGVKPRCDLRHSSGLP